MKTKPEDQEQRIEQAEQLAQHFEGGIENYADKIRVPYESEDRIKHAKTKGILKNGKRWYPNPKGRLCGEVCTLVLNESFWSTGNKFLNGTCKVS